MCYYVFLHKIERSFLTHTTLFCTHLFVVSLITTTQKVKLFVLTLLFGMFTFLNGIRESYIVSVPVFYVVALYTTLMCVATVE